MIKRIEYQQGDIIGNCTFIEEKPIKSIGLQKNKTKRRVVLFQCICGNQFETYLLNVKYGTTKSCGCIRDSKIKAQGIKNQTHGKRHHPLYKMWQGMIRRCNIPKDFAYSNYGGRGIKVCDRWLDIDNFLEDMYPSYIKGLELDRIDVNGNYELSNCRWVTRKQNMNNTRRNRIIEYKGVKKTVSEWADHLNIPYRRLLARINNWDVEKAFAKISYR